MVRKEAGATYSKRYVQRHIQEKRYKEHKETQESKNVQEQNDSQQAKPIEGMASFMGDVFSNHLTTKNHIDMKINWLLGVSGLILSVSLPFIIQNPQSINHFGLIIIAFSALITFLLCLMNLELPGFLKKTPHVEGSVMFYRESAYKTVDEIHQDFKNIKSHDDILRQYAITIHNLLERNIKLKNKLFKASSKILLTGIVIGFAIILVSFFTGL